MPVFNADKALQDQTETAVRILKGGGVVAIPTDTLYGLAADALNEKAVERIFSIKGRSKGMALHLLLADADDIAKWAVDIPDLAWLVTQRFWPGALTLVLKKGESISDAVSGGLDTIALRVPNHHVPRAIARGLGVPITGTSANLSGSPGRMTAEAGRREFGSEVDLVIDAGDASKGLASTVLDLSGKQPRILREGAVSLREIEELCGESVVI